MKKQTPQARELPRWATVSVSIVIVFHFSAIVFLVLAASSGPWLITFGPVPSSDAVGPPFATAVNQVTANYYLRPLQMTHNYHFLSNHAGEPGVFFEAKVKNAEGDVIETVKIPSEDANFWVRHRQKLLARGLYQDQMVQRSGTEKIAPPNQKTDKTYYWISSEDGKKMTLESRPSGANPPREVQVRPSGWSLVLAKSYMRHLRKNIDQADSVELFRHTREQIRPEMMVLPKEHAKAAIDAIGNREVVASFKELSQ